MLLVNFIAFEAMTPKVDEVLEACNLNHIVPWPQLQPEIVLQQLH